jgi:hypothetical protein
MLQAGPFTAAKCPAALREASASTKGVTYRDRLSGGARLTEKTREAHGWVYGEAGRALAVTPTCTVYTSASPSSAFFVVALQAQGLYDAVTHLQPCEVPRSMLSLRYCALSHSARSHRAPLHRSTAPHPHTDNAASCRLPTHVIVMLRLPRSLRTHDTVLAPARVFSEHHGACTPAPSEQQVHSKVSLRRAVDAV